MEKKNHDRHAGRHTHVHKRMRICRTCTNPPIIKHVETNE